MRSFLNDYITTLSSRQQERVGFILDEAKVAKAQLNVLVEKLTSRGIYSNLDLGRENTSAIIQPDQVALALRDAQKRLEDVYQTSNIISLILNSNAAVLTADVKALEDELVALEKSVQNYAFLLSDGGAYDYAFLESFSDDKNKEEQFDFLIPDRAGRLFGTQEQATIHTDEGMLSIPASINRDYPLTGLVLANNAQSYVTSDTGIENSTTARPDSGWRIAISSPGPVTGTLSEFRSLYPGVPEWSEFPGTNIVLEYTLAAPSPCDTIKLAPFSDIPFEVVQIVLYEDLEESKSKALLQAPIQLEGSQYFYFQLQGVAKFKVYLRQRTYTRTSFEVLKSESVARAVFRDIIRLRSIEGLSDKKKTRFLYRIHFKNRRKNSNVFKVALPAVDFDKTWGVFRDHRQGNLNGGFSDARYRWSNSLPSSHLFQNMLRRRLAFGDFGSLFPGIEGQGPNGLSGNGTVENYETNVFPRPDLANNPFIVTKTANQYEYNLGLQSVQIGSGAKGFHGYFVSKAIPSPGDVGEVKIKVSDLNYLDVGTTKDQPLVTSTEYSVTNQSKPRNEEDWVPILPVGESTVKGERFLPDSQGKGYLRFVASVDDGIILYKNGYAVNNIDIEDLIIRSSNRQTARGLKLPTGFATQEDIFTVDYIPATDATIVNFEKAGYNTPPLVSSFDDDGAGEGFTGTSGQLVIQLKYEPFIDYASVNESTYIDDYGLSPYNPVIVKFDTGEVAHNLTNYTGGTQSLLDSSSSDVQFIQNGMTLMFNRAVSDSFRVYYQYLPNNLRFRVVLRSNSKDFVTPKVDFVQVKAKTRKADARKSG